MIPNWVLENALKWFNPDEYLKVNPDVAADPYWGLHPLWHFISSGYAEGRTWKGDPRQPGATNPEPEEPPVTEPGTNSPASHTVWVDKFSGKEKTTKFSTSGDNPQFKRFGAVAFGYWPGSPNRYVYNTKYKNGGVGYVEYHPELTGRYEIKWYFRKTENRSKTPCDVMLSSGEVEDVDLKEVSQYAAVADYTSVVIGTVDLTAGDYIVCMPGDRKSISFGKMVFTRK
ncbi:hypothetical protein LCGC14_1411700 [marine sediment metagenome]|uniref:Uncharacterized protein n=1 Tax=marine sediment metagenome TaxID=412755 RepID=A0A0F9M9H8_9ZZZZ